MLFPVKPSSTLGPLEKKQSTDINSCLSKEHDVID